MPWVAAAVQHPNLLYLRGLYHEISAVREPTARQRLAHLQRAARAYASARPRLDGDHHVAVLDDLSPRELDDRLQLVVHQLGQRGFARAALREVQTDPEVEAWLRLAELQIAEGDAEVCLPELVARAEAAEDREAWLVAAAACRAVADEPGVRRCVRAARSGAAGGYRAGHRGVLARDLQAWIDATEGLDHTVFVGGVGRSGTTLLRAMLHAHPALYAGPELKLLPETGAFSERLWSFRGALADAGVSVDEAQAAFDHFVRAVVAAVPANGLRVVEKTPANVVHMSHLARCFPASRFLHILRDGRDVVASLLEQDWVEPTTGRPLDICHDARAAAACWRDTILRARCQSAWLLGRVHELRYEQLVADPERVMRRVLAFLGEPWDDRVLDHARGGAAHPPSESSSPTASTPVFTTSVGRWERVLSAPQLEAVLDEAGDLLGELGYLAAPARGV